MLVPTLSSLSTFSAEQAARRLLGCRLVRELAGQRLIVRITEVEAYDQTDEASHTFKGYSKRSATMFGPAGHLYVYFTYGMHYCCNIVVGKDGFGAGVLIRAGEPIEGEAIMAKNRHGVNGVNLTNGPAKLCQALMIDRNFDGHDLSQPPISLELMPPLPLEQIGQSERIGISKAKQTPWRFFDKESRYLSRVV